MKAKSILLALSISMFITTIQAQTWIQMGSDFQGEDRMDNLGYAVCLNADGTIVAFSAIGDNTQNGGDSGKVSIYQNVNGVWTQLGQDILGDHQADRIGWSLSLSSDGHILAIGSPFQGTGGTVKVYQYVNDSWIQVGQNISCSADDSQAGRSVSLSSDGSILAVGYPYADNGNNTDAGMVRVFQYDSIAGLWTQIGQDIFGQNQGDNAGFAVDLSSDGSILAIGAPMGNSNNSGYAQIYQYANGAWTQIGQNIPGEASSDEFGRSVSLNDDGSILAVGAIFYDGNYANGGQVRIFQNQNGVWTQIGAINGHERDEYFGWSVGLNSDGSIVAAGAYHNQTHGHVRVYQNINGVWTQIGSDIDGEPYDGIGHSISLSSNGSIVAVGAPYWRISGNDYGRTVVYHAPAFIITQPVSQNNICPGSDISFTITGNFIDHYQWQESTDSGTTWTDITDGGVYSGANTATLSISGVSLGMNNNQYRCVTSNSYGTTISNTATLITDNEAPVIPTLPDLTGECSVTASPPTTSDNCAGTITGTTTDPLTYTQQGTYTIHWTFDDGNGNTATAEQTVIVADTTAPTITCAGNQTVDADQTHTYTVSGTEFDPVSTNDNCNVHSVYNDFNSASTLAGASLPEGTTTITWHVTDDAGNESTCSFDVTVNAYLSVTNLLQKGISIYPNPVNRMLIVDFSSPSGQEKIKTIKISDITGKIIRRYPVAGKQTLQMDLSALSKDVYFIYIETNRGNYVGKIIKK